MKQDWDLEIFNKGYRQALFFFATNLELGQISAPMGSEETAELSKCGKENREVTLFYSIPK